MSQKIIDQARILGDLISQSEELKHMREEEAKFANDPIAQELVGKYQQKQNQMNQAKQNNQEIPSEDKAEYDALENQLESNATISAYLKAQGEFSELMDGINFLIMKAINGDSDSCDSHSGGCSSCSGCH
jgi:cell fate (sporulation/competence/biofilm development) regulator YlbF (YheA/YmcA/DUF963 family)